MLPIFRALFLALKVVEDADGRRQGGNQDLVAVKCRHLSWRSLIPATFPLLHCHIVAATGHRFSSMHDLSRDEVRYSRELRSVLERLCNTSRVHLRKLVARRHLKGLMEIMELTSCACFLMAEFDMAPQ